MGNWKWGKGASAGDTGSLLLFSLSPFPLWVAVLLAFAAVSAAGAASFVLEGQNKGGTNIWTAGNLKNWQELDYIPCRIRITGGPLASQSLAVSFPHLSGTVPGFQDLYDFRASSNLVFLSPPTLSNPPDADWSYHFAVRVTDDNAATVGFLARFAAGSHQPPGSSLMLSGTPSSMGNLQIHKPTAAPGSPDLAIHKRGPASARPGNIITYSLTYTNQSDVSTAVGAQISDVLPTGITVLANSLGANAQLAGHIIYWDLADLAAHASGQISFQAQVDLGAPVGAVLTNLAQIFSAEDDANYADNISTWGTTVAAPCLVPPLACGINKTVECGAAWSFDPPAVSDAAASNSLVILSTVTNAACGDTFSATRTWQATDDCGNTAQCSQTVTVTDTTAPAFGCPTNRTVELGSAWHFDEPTATDGCGTISIAILNTITNAGCGNTFSATRLWQATDACGNTSQCSQTITVADTSTPTITCATNHIVECSLAWRFDEPIASDLGGDVVVTVVSTTTNTQCGATFLATRTWLATDACGNTNSCSQTVAVVDTTAPILLCSSNRLVECGAEWDFEAPMVSDSCEAEVALTILGTVTNRLCGATFIATRTWLATDACGNSNMCSQTVEIVDTTAPVLVCASNRVVECSTAWEFEPPVASDTCDTIVQVTVLGSTTNAHCGAAFSATRSWLAVDACGNSNSCSQTVEVVDTTAPVITCSSNIVVECTGRSPVPVSFSLTTSDACDANVLVYSVPPSGTAFALGTNIVQAYAVDSCLNTNTCSFAVTVVDTTAPAIVCPPDLVVAEAPRDAGSAVVTYALPATSDVCDEQPSVAAAPVSGSAFPVGVNVVHAVATDDSGNSTACSFTVRVIPYRLYVTNHADAGPGTLRQALLDANDAPGENLVLFDLPGAGRHTIAVETALPALTGPIVIDGQSQPGFADRPLVEISGNSLSNRVDGLVLSAGQCTIRGLVLNGFATALRLETPGQHVVQGNFIGIDATGTNVAGNTGDGIYITSGGNLVGGTNQFVGNVIGGNGGSGIRFDGTAAALNLVRGNFIGLGFDGRTAVGNALDGLRVENGAARNTIGWTGGSAANVIAFNGGTGINLLPTAGSPNTIFPNQLYDNGALGIDLGNDGPTANDPDDADAGPNELLNTPVLTDARHDGGLIVEGSFTSKPDAKYRLDFWLNNTADPSGYGEGQFHLGSTVVALDETGTANFAVGFAVGAVYTQYVTATAMDALGHSSEFSPARPVRTPPVLEVLPVSTNTSGGTVTFCVTASGTPPIYYQWRHNGMNIPGATNQCYTIPLAEVGDAGSYTVVVYNELGGSMTPPAKLRYDIPNFVPAGDNFVDRVPIAGQSGLLTGNNFNATREPGEPPHAGKPGGPSVWYTWQAPITGIATIGTRGSDFDTLLGVYVGTNVNSLIAEASDEDSGGAFTSGLRFNAIKGRQYHFAIDGYGGESGSFIFGWQMEDTPHLLPLIFVHPQSQTVAPGDTVTFYTIATRECGGGQAECPRPDQYPHEQLPGLSVQWFFEGNPIPGETNYSLILSNVQTANVGRYVAQVTAKYDSDGVNRTADSRAADLQLNLTGDGSEAIQANDKLLDSLLGRALTIGATPPASSRTSISRRDGGVVRGYTGTQIFNTAGSTTSSAEDLICGLLGGASEWITFVAVESGDLFLNTDGSSYDTVMAVFSRNPTNAALLTQLACDNNSGIDHLDSSLVVPVTAGQTNAILIDGVNGASGTLKLNYSLVPKTSIKLLGITPDNQNALQVTGRTNLNFSILRSTNLIHWTAILTTNAPSGVFNYLDPAAGSRQFYRVRALP